ncbi:MAG: hypothetical protein KKH41_09060 [Candidatus Thermoplasmatota archaeon]|nr:hypothetical protein [Euryarchaeota archaeon]MBU4032823.1 hypothetical protein [Candidatus Thermoplasmatota archaeon]MBU4071548.1 hypothetical protein [Candidatus Thermoplasmatota archaeon]MBU4144492.1 hypothetical protein [Candidatus Thermoplasmatota archaeon]MBU4592714.1 hypothetical protein [Candidatus Thermoplasmatota archaeon]
MPTTKYSEAQQSVFGMPVFGVGDLVQRGVPRNYAKKYLHEKYKAGKILRIERDKYTCADDLMAVASSITYPSYLSLWAAMSIRGMTTQIPFAIQVMTSRKRFNRNIEFDGTRLNFYTLRSEMMFGYEYIPWNDGVRIPVARPEKILIDAIYFNAIQLDEFDESREDIDAGLLMDYAELTGNARVINAVVRWLDADQ